MFAPLKVNDIKGISKQEKRSRVLKRFDIGGIMKNLTIRGGPEKKSFNRDNVTTVSFTEDDPFWDVGGILNSLEKNIRSGNIEDLILIQRKKGELHIHWRGTNPMTTALGMLRWGEQNILDENK